MIRSSRDSALHRPMRVDSDSVSRTRGRDLCDLCLYSCSVPSVQQESDWDLLTDLALPLAPGEGALPGRRHFIDCILGSVGARLRTGGVPADGIRSSI